MLRTILFIAALLLIAIPLIEKGWFKYQLYRMSRGREKNASLTYDITEKVGEYVRTPYSLMGWKRICLRRRMTVAGYLLVALCLISLLIF